MKSLKSRIIVVFVGLMIISPSFGQVQHCTEPELSKSIELVRKKIKYFKTQINADRTRIEALDEPFQIARDEAAQAKLALGGGLMTIGGTAASPIVAGVAAFFGFSFTADGALDALSQRKSTDFVVKSQNGKYVNMALNVDTVNGHIVKFVLADHGGYGRVGISTAHVAEIVDEMIAKMQQRHSDLGEKYEALRKKNDQSWAWWAKDSTYIQSMIYEALQSIELSEHFVENLMLAQEELTLLCSKLSQNTVPAK